MKRLFWILLAVLMLTGCDILLEEEGPREDLPSESEPVLTSADALQYVIAAADEHLPLEEGTERSYEYRKRTTKKEDTTCYIYNIIDDYGDYRKVVGRYAAAADGSLVLWYDIDTDQYLPFE